MWRLLKDPRVTAILSYLSQWKIISSGNAQPDKKAKIQPPRWFRLYITRQTNTKNAANWT